jgi:hypothetical protein
MANPGTAWSLFGKAFLLACEETGKAIADVSCEAGNSIAAATHSTFQTLADKTKPTNSVEKVVTPAQEESVQ